MMLTSLPPSLLHRVHDATTFVRNLAELGLAFLCPCGTTPCTTTPAARWLAEEPRPLERLGQLVTVPEELRGAVLPSIPTERLAGLVPLETRTADESWAVCGCGWSVTMPLSMGWWVDLVFEQHGAVCPLEPVERAA